MLNIVFVYWPIGDGMDQCEALSMQLRQNGIHWFDYAGQARQDILYRHQYSRHSISFYGRGEPVKWGSLASDNVQAPREATISDMFTTFSRLFQIWKEKIRILLSDTGMRYVFIKRFVEFISSAFVKSIQYGSNSKDIYAMKYWCRIFKSTLREKGVLE